MITVSAKDVAANPFSRSWNFITGTLLHTIAMVHAVFAVPDALEYGADINVRDNFGFTPAHYAVQVNDAPMLVTILDDGGDINAADIHGNTPLHVAAGLGNSKLCRLLLKRGAEITRNKQGLTPLQVTPVMDKSDLTSPEVIDFKQEPGEWKDTAAAFKGH